MQTTSKDMVDHPLVSIVTPGLNPGARLARCLDSVAAQTYPRVEHIVIDGGSRDGTVELLRERGVTFVSEPDRGQSHAINKGFAIAHGQWLGWLNTDDVLTPRAIELAMAVSARNPAIGWIYGDCDMRSGGERQLLAKPPPHVDATTFDSGETRVPPGSLIARWALDRVGQLDERFHLAMDFDLWIRLVDGGVPTVYVPEILAVFEIHPDSKSSSIAESEFDLEIAAALYKSGRSRAAALVLGRAAASAARGRRERIGRGLLERELARLAPNVERGTRRDLLALRASAHAEAGLHELYARPRSFRHLLRPEPWIVPETRTRLFAAVVRAFAKRIRVHTA